MSNEKDATRRRVLKTSLGAGIIPVAPYRKSRESNEEDPSFEEEIKKACEIEEEYGTQKMISYMKERGHQVGINTSTHEIGHKARDPKLEKIQDPEGVGIKGNVVGFYNSHGSNNEYWISIGIKHKIKVKVNEAPNGECFIFPSYSDGSAPIDAAGLAWNVPNEDPMWEVVDDDKISDFAYTYGDHTDWDDGTYKPNLGIGYTIDDLQVYLDWREENIPEGGLHCPDTGLKEEYVYAGRCGVKIEPAGDYAPSEREVYASYTHTWRSSTSNVGLDLGVSAGAGGGIGVGITITPQSKVEQEDTQTEEDGDTLLKISQEEILDDGPCC